MLSIKDRVKNISKKMKEDKKIQRGGGPKRPTYEDSTVKEQLVSKLDERFISNLISNYEDSMYEGDLLNEFNGDWDKLSLEGKLEEDFILKHGDKINWKNLIQNSNLRRGFSGKIKKKYGDKIEKANIEIILERDPHYFDDTEDDESEE